MKDIASNDLAIIVQFIRYPNSFIYIYSFIYSSMHQYSSIRVFMDE